MNKTASLAILLAGASLAESAPTLDKSQLAMPVPANISAEAVAYYRSLRPRPPRALDIKNPKILAFTRKFLGDMFRENADKLGIEFELEKIDADGVTAYWLNTGTPDDHDKVLIYLHGGGMTLGSATTSLVTPIRVATESKLRVLSVEYRLAPEHPFPAAVDDSLAAYRWLLQQGYDAKKIGVFGDSAGGNLAVVMPLLAKEKGLPMPGAIVSISPSADRTRSGDTYTSLREFDPILGAGPPAPEVYAVDHPLDHPLVSPVFADLSGLPPTLIQVGSRERLLSDATRLARRARLAGVDVTLDVWDGMWHVWQDHPDLPEAQQATAEIAAYFADHLARDAATIDP